MHDTCLDLPHQLEGESVLAGLELVQSVDASPAESVLNSVASTPGDIFQALAEGGREGGRGERDSGGGGGEVEDVAGTPLKSGCHQTQDKTTRARA